MGSSKKSDFAYWVFLGIAALFISSRSQAFTLESEGSASPSGWPTHNIAINLDPTCANDPLVVAGLNSAVAIWNDLPSSDLVLSVGSTQSLGGSITSFTTGSPSFVGGPLIFCDTNFVADFGFPLGKIPGLDVAPTLDCASGQTFCPIKGGLVVLNADASDPDHVDNLKTATLAVVIAHELGHALGLGHSADVNALMYFDATAKTQLALAQDDVNGISYLYPRNEVGGDGVWGCGTLAMVGAGGGKAGERGKSSGPLGDRNAMMEFALFLASCYAMVFYSKRLSRN